MSGTRPLLQPRLLLASLLLSLILIASFTDAQSPAAKPSDDTDSELQSPSPSPLLVRAIPFTKKLRRDPPNPRRRTTAPEGSDFREWIPATPSFSAGKPWKSRVIAPSIFADSTEARNAATTEREVAGTLPSMGAVDELAPRVSSRDQSSPLRNSRVAGSRARAESESGNPNESELGIRSPVTEIVETPVADAQDAIDWDADDREFEAELTRRKSNVHATSTDGKPITRAKVRGSSTPRNQANTRTTIDISSELQPSNSQRRSAQPDGDDNLSIAAGITPPKQSEPRRTRPEAGVYPPQQEESRRTSNRTRPLATPGNVDELMDADSPSQFPEQANPEPAAAQSKPQVPPLPPQQSPLSELPAPARPSSNFAENEPTEPLIGGIKAGQGEDTSDSPFAVQPMPASPGVDEGAANNDAVPTPPLGADDSAAAVAANANESERGTQPGKATKSASSQAVQPNDNNTPPLTARTSTETEEMPEAVNTELVTGAGAIVDPALAPEASHDGAEDALVNPSQSIDLSEPKASSDVPEPNASSRSKSSPTPSNEDLLVERSEPSKAKRNVERESESPTEAKVNDTPNQSTPAKLANSTTPRTQASDAVKDERTEDEAENSARATVNQTDSLGDAITVPGEKTASVHSGSGFWFSSIIVFVMIGCFAAVIYKGTQVLQDQYEDAPSKPSNFHTSLQSTASNGHTSSVLDRMEMGQHHHQQPGKKEKAKDETRRPDHASKHSSMLAEKLLSDNDDEEEATETHPLRPKPAAPKPSVGAMSLGGGSSKPARGLGAVVAVIDSDDDSLSGTKGRKASEDGDGDGDGWNDW